MKTLLLAFATLLFFANSPVAVAQEIKIGFVSTERVFREAAPAVRALKKLEKEFAPREDDPHQVDHRRPSLTRTRI